MSLREADLLYKTIVSNIETEKSYNRLANSRYTFEVNLTSSKTDVRKVIETLYSGVKVDSINMLLRKGKVKRTRRGYSKRTDKKFAIVNLSGALDTLSNLQVSTAVAEGDSK